MSKMDVNIFMNILKQVVSGFQQCIIYKDLEMSKC